MQSCKMENDLRKIFESRVMIGRSYNAVYLLHKKREADSFLSDLHQTHRLYSVQQIIRTKYRSLETELD
jgi:hypothetical protein